MNLLDRIYSTQEALSFRDHVAKVLKDDLTLNFKQRKLDELVAHILGAKDWNTVMGAKPAYDVDHDICEFTHVSINPQDIIGIIQDHIAETNNNALIKHIQAACFSIIEAANSGELKVDRTLFDKSHFPTMVVAAHDRLFANYDAVVFGEDYEVYVYELCRVGLRSTLITRLIKLGVDKRFFQDRDFLTDFKYLTDYQVEQAMSCILDSQYEPEDTEMLAFKYDSSLRNELLEYAEKRSQ